MATMARSMASGPCSPGFFFLPVLGSDPGSWGDTFMPSALEVGMLMSTILKETLRLETDST